MFLLTRLPAQEEQPKPHKIENSLHNTKLHLLAFDFLSKVERVSKVGEFNAIIPSFHQKKGAA